MKLLSEAAEYGLRAVVWLAQRPRTPYKTRQIAAGTQTAPGYLLKSLQALSKAGILSGQRGSSGGFSLVSDPESLTVLEIINAVDPLERIHVCPLGLEAHGKRLCPLHRRVDDAIAAVERAFKDTTIAEVLRNPSRSIPLCPGLYLGDAADSVATCNGAS